ncbi:MAG: rane-associated protein [Patescibacteria group bacterium]|nr:rane-associated protein [Patescibacteria group bacterium]
MAGLNVEEMLRGAGVLSGLLIVGGIVFAESGLLIGFFLPGDTLIFTAGFFAAQGQLPLGWLILVIVVAAIAGDNVGYTIGKRTGHKIFRKQDGLFFRQEYIKKAEAFYEKHGGKTIILARFVPVVRTFAPMVAGVGKMSHKRFFAFNVVGGVVWGAGVTLLGYWLGSKIPNIDKYLLPIVGLAMLFTFSPMILHIIKDKQLRKDLWAKITHRKPKTETK